MRVTRYRLQVAGYKLQGADGFRQHLELLLGVWDADEVGLLLDVPKLHKLHKLHKLQKLQKLQKLLQVGLLLDVPRELGLGEGERLAEHVLDLYSH